MDLSLTHSLFKCLNIGMAQIMNINAAPIVSPDGTYLVALKEGRFCRIKGTDMTQDSEVKDYVDAACQSTAKNCLDAYEELKIEIKTLKAKIAELESNLTSTSEEPASVETAEETPVAEAPKAKSKKSKK